MHSQSFSETPHAAAEIERPFFLEQRLHGFGITDHFVDFYNSALEEFIDLPRPISVFSPRENGAERILTAEKIPVFLERAKVQVQLSTNRTTK